MTKQELLLIALSSDGTAEFSPVQIQKLIFLIEKNVAAQLGGSVFEFVPYDYGPFDSSIYEELRRLKVCGLVASVPTFQGWEKHAVTTEGLAEGYRLAKDLPPSVYDYIKQLSIFVRSLSFGDLVSAVYKAYPEMRVNSVFKTV